MSYLHGANRHAAIVCPARLDDYIPADNPGRFLAAFVDHRPLEGRGFQRATPATPGRPTTQRICCSAIFMALSSVCVRVGVEHRSPPGMSHGCGV
jgi:hypothetical protein